MFDYVTLKFIWWILVGVLLTGFAVMDGHDMGVGTLLPFVGKTDVERRVIINTVGPHWDGNQVWFITGGGAIFAAWPLVYATAFSGLYWAMLLVLWALFFRPVGFDYRSKIDNPTWRRAWDWGLFIGGAVPPLLFGVAFGNLLQGLPFTFDDYMVPHYEGSFWGLLNPFGLLCGVVSSAMITMHGAMYLAHRTEGAIQARAIKGATGAALVCLASFVIGGFYVAHLNGYRIASSIDPNAIDAVMAKTVTRAPGAWLDNYRAMPWTVIFPILGLAGPALAIVAVRAQKTLSAFTLSALAEAGIIGTAGVSMFPFLMPSSSHPAASLTAWDAVSSHTTLAIMFWVALIFVPIILAYTSWAYRVMRGKVVEEQILRNEHALY
ncbi:MAG TPA: cytochrome d ubiquinol oxidase subunit II [Burkholderiaceae bacterium]